jgi:hypothetical protein
MGERAITYVDTPRSHDDDKSVSHITDAVWIGSFASDMLDVVFDAQHSDPEALTRPVLRTARQMYRELAQQIVRDADFFESSPASSQVNRLSGSPWIEDRRNLDAAGRKQMSRRFEDVADALDRLDKLDTADVNLLQREFRTLAKGSLAEARNASEKSIRVSPWSTH